MRGGRLALTFFALLISTAAAAEPCFRTPDQNACLTAASLAAQGVGAVTLVPKSLLRDEDAQTTAWSLLAYSLSPLAPVLNLDGILPLLVQGEESVLSSQDQLCAPLLAAGVACHRDLLHGAWTAADTKFVFSSQTTAPFEAAGTFSATRFACKAGAAEKELVCSGTYETTLRLLYLNNLSFMNLSAQECAESGVVRPAAGGVSSLPDCIHAAGTYAAEIWSPLAPGQHGYVVSANGRVKVELPGATNTLNLRRTGF